MSFRRKHRRHGGHSYGARRSGRSRRIASYGNSRGGIRL